MDMYLIASCVFTIKCQKNKKTEKYYKSGKSKNYYFV